MIAGISHVKTARAIKVIHDGVTRQRGHESGGRDATHRGVVGGEQLPGAIQHESLDPRKSRLRAQAIRAARQALNSAKVAAVSGATTVSTAGALVMLPKTFEATTL